MERGAPLCFFLVLFDGVFPSPVSIPSQSPRAAAVLGRYSMVIFFPVPGMFKAPLPSQSHDLFYLVEFAFPGPFFLLHGPILFFAVVPPSFFTIRSLTDLFLFPYGRGWSPFPPAYRSRFFLSYLVGNFSFVASSDTQTSNDLPRKPAFFPSPLLIFPERWIIPLSLFPRRFTSFACPGALHAFT